MYYLPTIHVSGSLGSMVDIASKEANDGKESLTKVLPSVNILSKEIEQPKVTEKATNITKEVVHDANLPPTVPKDPSKEKEASYNMEIVLATLLIPTKEDLKGKGPTSSTVVAST